MNIDLNYIKGIADTALDLYEQSDGRIEPDKELTLRYEEVWSSSKTQIIGTKITFTWYTWLSSKWDKEHKVSENHLIIYEKDKLSSVIADISSIYSDIHKTTINY